MQGLKYQTSAEKVRKPTEVMRTQSSKTLM